MVARLAAAVSAGMMLSPAAALAQAAEDAGSRNYGWLWIIAAAFVVIALFRMFFAGSGRLPPRRP